MDTTITTLKGETGRDARRRIRGGTNLAPTAGMAPGYVQGNLAILPKEFAADFARFCALNPKPCPLLGQSEPRQSLPIPPAGEAEGHPRRRAAGADRCRTPAAAPPTCSSSSPAA